MCVYAIQNILFQWKSTLFFYYTIFVQVEFRKTASRRPRCCLGPKKNPLQFFQVARSEGLGNTTMSHSWFNEWIFFFFTILYSTRFCLCFIIIYLHTAGVFKRKKVIYMYILIVCLLYCTYEKNKKIPHTFFIDVSEQRSTLYCHNIYRNFVIISSNKV